jgi:hypothetical protein
MRTTTLENKTEYTNYYDDPAYRDELDFRSSEFYYEHLRDAVDCFFDSEGIQIRYSELDQTRNGHYYIPFSAAAGEVIRQKQAKLVNERVFRWLIAKHGLGPDIMFRLWKGEPYIEIYENYFDEGINKRLRALADVIEVEAEALAEEYSSKLYRLVTKVEQCEFFTGSDEDYKEFLVYIAEQGAVKS